VDDYIALATRAAALEVAGSGHRYVPLHGMRAALLEHDGEWYAPSPPSAYGFPYYTPYCSSAMAGGGGALLARRS
jgi:hypothetical protein